MCVCHTLFPSPSQLPRELWWANEARKVEKTVPECSVLGRHKLGLFDSILPDVILL